MKRSILFHIFIIALCLPGLSFAAKKKTTKKPKRQSPSMATAHLPTDSFAVGDSIPELAKETQEMLVSTGAELLENNVKSFKVGSDYFTSDCIGFVETVYHTVGIPFRDVMSMLGQDGGSAVRTAYIAVKKYGILFKDEVTPEPGDLIFWDNTFDYDRDGRYDDPLTHIGMVAEVLPDGTVKYIHRGGKGVSYGYMNISTPDISKNEAGEAVNSQLRVKGKKDSKGVKYRAGELFVAFGRFDPDKLGPAFKKQSKVDFEVLGGGSW